MAVVKVFTGTAEETVGRWCVHHVDWYEVSGDRDLEHTPGQLLHQSDNNTTPAVAHATAVVHQHSAAACWTRKTSLNWKLY